MLSININLQYPLFTCCDEFYLGIHVYGLLEHP